MRWSWALIAPTCIRVLSFARATRVRISALETREAIVARGEARRIPGYVSVKVVDHAAVPTTSPMFFEASGAISMSRAGRN